MESAFVPVLVVSPHFDDAVLSCWSVLDRYREEACVLTVFGGVPSAGHLWPWDALPPSAADSATRVRERHEENREALAATGSAHIELGLLERQYPGGGTVHPSDLRALLLRATTIYAPADAGIRTNHQDHRAVRDIVLQLRPDASLYADQPYCKFPTDLGLLLTPTGYDKEVVVLTSEQAERKARAISCYVGEVERLDGLRKRLKRPNEEFIHEVVWHPHIPAAGSPAAKRC
jgi:LmbE family N-acetylglucosaminyl deacetylase